MAATIDDIYYGNNKHKNMAATITIPTKVKEKLDELSRSKDEPFEELLITALNRTYSIL